MTETITITKCICLRCNYKWWPKVTDELIRTGLAPRVCPGCKSPYWDRPRREKKS